MDVSVSPPAEERPVQYSPSIAYSRVAYQTGGYQMGYETLGAAGRLWLRPGVEIALGVRGAFGSSLVQTAFEGFTAVQLAPHFRALGEATGGWLAWRPALGVELGVTTIEHDPKKLYGPGAPTWLAREQPGAVYVMFQSSPLRFRVTRKLDVTALGLGVGTGLGTPGRQVRLQFTLLEIGLVL